MSLDRLIAWLSGRDTEVRRQIRYYLIAVVVYAIGASLIAFQYANVMIPLRAAQILWSALGFGVVASYLLIRLTPITGLSSHQNTLIQMVYSLACVVGCYAVAGPSRGGILTVLIVTLMFGAFSASQRQMAAICAVAISLLGGTMILMVTYQPERYRAVDEITIFVLASSMMAVVAYLSSRLASLRHRLFQQKSDLAEALARVRILATRDELTGLMNRRSMLETLERMHGQSARDPRPVALALIDLDRFKQINDTRGHAVGDEVLRGFGQIALETLRQSDLVARWGGEEFLVAFPDCKPDEAEGVLERLHQAVRDCPVSESDPGLRVTFSAGLAVLGPREGIQAVLERSDRAMYQAKSLGRCRTVVAVEGHAGPDSDHWLQLPLFEGPARSRSRSHPAGLEPPARPDRLADGGPDRDPVEPSAQAPAQPAEPGRHAPTVA